MAGLQEADMDHGDLERLTRWETAGGTWELLSRTDGEVTVSLCTCDGGEEMDRITSADPGLLRYVLDRLDRAEE
jgi:hypothetical protein